MKIMQIIPDSLRIIRVLFVSSGNGIYGISPIVKNQALSLEKLNCKIYFFSVSGKGLAGYIKSYFTLLFHLLRNKYDLIHAHYFYCGIISALTFRFPVICSIMGVKSLENKNIRSLVRLFAAMMWKNTIVKTAEMGNIIGAKYCSLIPNGVDLEKFKTIDKRNALTKVKFDENYFNIIFLSDPNRAEKNYALAEKSVQKISKYKVKLHAIYGISNSEIPIYLSAADLLLLTSSAEGSPNAIKEAMACNLPIVSTNVGDVEAIMGETEGCFLTSRSADDIAEKIELALQFVIRKKNTKGRERIIKLKLDDESIAKKIMIIYNDNLKEKYS